MFYFDFAGPGCYLAAENIAAAGIDCRWQPVNLHRGPAAEPDAEAIASRAAELRLPPIRWPSLPLQDPLPCLYAATYAKRLQRVVAFSLAALRQAYAAGRDLAVTDNVLIAAASCELHPRAVLQAMQTRSVHDELEHTSETARHAGATEVPALLVDKRPFFGAEAIERAVAMLGQTQNR